MSKRTFSSIGRMGAVSSLAVSFFLAAPAFAQDGPEADSTSAAAAAQLDTTDEDGGDAARSAVRDTIVVTARRREEEAIDVPVAISAISAEQIDRQNLTTLEGFADTVPSLAINTGAVSYGGALTLRGISSATSVSSVDQAVTINVDGIPISYAGIVKVGQFDLGQVEVLKGPQALFFGKNATGGIISLKSAEPTDELFVQLRGSYEVEAEEWVTEGIISGPITDTLGVRLAARYGDREGIFNNYVPSPSQLPGAVPPPPDDVDGGAGGDDLIIKGMIMLDDFGPGQVKLTGGYAKQKIDWPLTVQQRIYCPGGSPNGPFTNGFGECDLDGRTTHSGIPAFANGVDSRFPANGIPYSDTEQYYGALDIAVDLTDNLSLNSVTGFYELNFDGSDNVSYAPIPAILYADTLNKRSVSQELRLSSDNDGPFNFMTGIFYQDDLFSDSQLVILPGGATNGITGDGFVIKGETISPFVQMNYDISDALSLSAGVRYTHETKKQRIERFNRSLYPDEITFTDWSPEVSLVYALSPDANIYAAYKQGYKSGGFQTEYVSIPASLRAGAPIDNRFDKETVEGGEIGFKARLMGGDLSLNTAAYYFEYSNLQLSRFDPALVANFLENIGAATSQGVEFDLTYSPYSIEGLTITAAGAYNDARYDEYIAPCWNGMTPAEGCNLATNTQDLKGEQLPRAPKLAGSVSAVYEGNFNDAIKYRLNGGVAYTGSSNSVADVLPESRQDDYFTFDAGAAVATADDQWELAFIGRNLTNEYWLGSGYQIPATGSPNSAATPGNPGGTVGTRADIGTTGVNRGRELWLRLTWRPFGM